MVLFNLGVATQQATYTHTVPQSLTSMIKDCVGIAAALQAYTHVYQSINQSFHVTLVHTALDQI